MSDQNAGYDPERVIADLAAQLGAKEADNARLRVALAGLLAERNDAARKGETATEHAGAAPAAGR